MELWISRFDMWMVIMDVVVGLVVVWIGSYELIDWLIENELEASMYLMTMMNYLAWWPKKN
jgi:hypothetical protein